MHLPLDAPLNSLMSVVCALEQHNMVAGVASDYYHLDYTPLVGVVLGDYPQGWIHSVTLGAGYAETRCNRNKQTVIT